MSQSGNLRSNFVPPVVATIYDANTGSAIPSGNVLNIFGGTVAAGTNPVSSTGSGNTITVNTQISQATASTDATLIGLSAFDSASFAVDANGFVTLLGGGEAIDSVALDTGTSPIVPTVAGLITLAGSIVAAGTNPVRTDGTGANTATIEVQTSQALAAADSTKIGLCNFDSAIFTCSATGFVSTSGGTLVQSLTGGPGVTITGTATVPIINSVIFTDSAAATLAVDNGYFATGAGTYNMPATAAQGEMIIVNAEAVGVILDCPALNFIRIGNTATSSGGTITSTAQGDSVTLRYRLSNLTWFATSVVGNWTIA